MAAGSKRGPKQGKRITPEVQTKIILSALSTNQTVDEIINDYKDKGYNFNKGNEDDLKNFTTYEVSFLLANRPILNKLKDEAISIFINQIKSK